MGSKCFRSALTLCVAFWCGKAAAQGDVLFPGSTLPGDILRGEGAMYKGAAVYHLNTAVARSLDSDTLMRGMNMSTNRIRSTSVSVPSESQARRPGAMPT